MKSERVHIQDHLYHFGIEDVPPKSAHVVRYALLGEFHQQMLRQFEDVECLGHIVGMHSPESECKV